MNPGFASDNDCDPPYSPTPKSVLMVTGGLARGGAERQMIALTHGLLQRGYDVQVFELIGLPAGQPSFADEFARMGVRVRHPCEFSAAIGDGFDGAAIAGLQSFALLLPANAARICRALMLAIQEFRPSAVNCWSDISNLLGGFVSSRMRVPRIVLGLRVLPPPFWFDARKSDLYRQAYRALAQEPSVVFVNNSASSVKKYERWMQPARGTIKLVHNGFLPSSMKVRKRSELAACRANL